YLLSVEALGFKKIERPVTIVSNSAPVLQFQLEIAPMAQSVNVVESPELIGSDSPTPTVLINREQIEVTPGGDRTNSLAVITNHVPSAYLIHDQLQERPSDSHPADAWRSQPAFRLVCRREREPE